MKTRITARMLQGLTHERVGSTDVVDALCRGLRVRATPSGVVAFSFIYSFGGRRRRRFFGRFPEMSLDAARTIVNGLRAALAEGRDPATVPITEVALPNGGTVPGFTAARPTTTFGDLSLRTPPRRSVVPLTASTSGKSRT